MNNHNRRYGMFTSSPARRVSWLGMITLLGCVLLNSASAQKTTEKVIPRATPTPKINVEKTTNTDTTAIHAMLTGSLSGTIYYYQRKGDMMLQAPCIYGDTRILLLGPNDKHVAFAQITHGKQNDKNAVCHYEIRDIPAGTYKVDTEVWSPGSQGLAALNTLDLRPMTIMNMDAHPFEESCTGGGSPCKVIRKTVTIVARKATVLDLSVKKAPNLTDP